MADNGRPVPSGAVAYAPNPDSEGWTRRPLRRRLRLGIGSSAASSYAASAVSHFLPAQYPQSVAPGYAHFCKFAFLASVAGSSAMVLSTQTLLLAVGVVGSTSTAASAGGAGVMAGALNWVLKDGVGQLGGVLYASRQSKSFDAHPKKTRMLAAIALDAASLLEILSPSVPLTAVLPVACLANVLKNVGYLTASASRAALHQSLSRGNLADVTAKAGSQSMAAGLLGTAVGIGLSAGGSLLQTPHDFVMAWCALSVVHQACNYWSLKSVVIDHFNRQRLQLVLQHYVDSDFREVHSPQDVAEQERYYDFVRFTTATPEDPTSWLVVGSRLDRACPKASDLAKYSEACSGDMYLLTVVAPLSTGGECKVHVTFFQSATGEDVICGLFHAFIVRRHLLDLTSEVALTATPWEAVREARIRVQKQFPSLLEMLHAAGWRTATELTVVEPGQAHRLVLPPSAKDAPQMV